MNFYSRRHYPALEAEACRSAHAAQALQLLAHFLTDLVALLGEDAGL